MPALFVACGRTPRSWALALLAIGAAAPVAHGDWVPDGVGVCIESHSQYGLSIAPDGAGGAILAWTDARFGQGIVYAQKISSSGAMLWSSNGVAVGLATGMQNFCSAQSDGQGGAVIFWADSRNSASTGTDIYTQRLDAQGVGQWGVSGMALATTAGNADAPTVSPDGASLLAPPGYDIAWMEMAATPAHTGQVRVQHVDRTGASMWTTAAVGGVGLSQAGAVLSDHSIALASDGAAFTFGAPNGAVAVWTQGDTGDIWARRVNAAGVAQWAAGGIGICTVAGPQQRPTLAYVGGGNVIIAWQDQRLPDADIYVQKLANTGVIQWVADGLPLCRAPGSQGTPAIVHDGSGGTFVAWQDGRSGTQKLYVQHINGSGSALWALDGIPLCPAGGTQTWPVLQQDGSGGAIVAWEDTRDGSQDIYLQRVDGAGNLLWNPTGLPLCSAAADQHSLVLVRTSTANAIVAWDDLRSGNHDIYAAGVLLNGAVTASPPALALPPAGMLLTSLSANPARGPVEFAVQGARPGPVILEVLDARGRRVRTLPLQTSRTAASARSPGTARTTPGRVCQRACIFCGHMPRPTTGW